MCGLITNAFSHRPAKTRAGNRVQIYTFFSILTPFLIRFFLNILKIKGLKRDFGTTAGLQKVLRGLLFWAFREEKAQGGGVNA